VTETPTPIETPPMVETPSKKVEDDPLNVKVTYNDYNSFAKRGPQ
jgi:hypothetical protein